MVKKSVNAEPSSKLSASELAASILRQVEQDREAEQAARLRDLEAYRAVMAEVAGTPSEGRGLPEWSNMMAAARILADRLGFSAAGDLVALDAIALEKSMTEQFGDLHVRELQLNAELGTGTDRGQAMGERHIREREELREHYRETGRQAIHVGRVRSEARTARGAVGHLTDEVVA